MQSKYISNPKIVALVALVISVIAFSFTPILAKLADQSGVNATLISGARLFFTSLILTPLVVLKYRHEIKAVIRRQSEGAIISGIAISWNLVLVVLALGSINIMINQVIIAMNPLWLAVLEMLLFKEHFAKPVWIGLTLALSGTIYMSIIAANQVNMGSQPTLGILLSIMASAIFLVYLLAGRSIRKSVSLVPYLWITYLAGGINGMIIAVISGQNIVNHSLESWVYVWLLVIIGTLIGHGSLNFALGYLPATLVSVASQAVVITSGLVAFWVFQEVPTSGQVIAGIVILIGVSIALLSQAYSKKQKVIKDLVPDHSNY
ncbi:hypothetical protein MASR2M15_01000 [Anaerolineales bacterium]